MTKKIIIFVLSILLFSQCVPNEPVKIGVNISLTGSLGSTGQRIKNALELSVAEINSKGGINNHPVELIFADNQSDAEEAVKLFAKMEKEDAPLFYITIASFISVALAPLAEEKEVVLAGLVVSTERFTRNRKWSFKYYPDVLAEFKPIEKVILRNNVKSIGVIHSDEEWGEQITNLFTTNLQHGQGISVDAFPFPLSEDDFSGYVEKVVDYDCVYITGFSSHLKNLIIALRKAGYQGIICGPSSLGIQTLREMPEMDGVYLAAPRIYSSDYPYGERVKARYEETFDGAVFDHYAATGYDFIEIMANLLQGQELTRDSVRLLLEQGFSYGGILGTIHVEPGNHDISFPLTEGQIKNKEIRYLN